MGTNVGAVSATSGARPHPGFFLLAHPNAIVHTVMCNTDPVAPVLEINYCGYHGRGTKGILGGTKGMLLYFRRPRLTTK